MMGIALPLLAIILLMTLVLGLVRIWRGPSAADRMLAAQLFGTTGVALLVVLAEIQDVPALRDVALTLAVLSILACLAFVRRWPGAEEQGDETSRGAREREVGT